MVVWVTFSCKKEYIRNEPDEPFNPYDTISKDENGSSNDSLDKFSLTGIHKNIFSTKCALSGCHDGSFEPDYRTIQSTYSTLVYHPIIKNNLAGDFEYRVIPLDTANSLLYERITNCCFVNQNDRMPQDATANNQLPQDDIDAIASWIMSGAKDIFGNTPVIANPQPATFGIVAFLGDTTGLRVDTIRSNEVYPFEVPADTIIDIWFGLYDDITPAPSFSYKKIKFTTSPLGFQTASEFDLILETTPIIATSFSGNLPYYYHYKINTTLYNINDIVYMRIYVQDASHSSPTEIPNDGSQYFLQSYFSFTIK